MTQQQNPTPDPIPTPTTAPAVAEPAPPVETEPPTLPEGAESSGYAVYDKTLAKYVTGVFSEKDAKKAADNGPEGHTLTVVKV